jgi:NAD(P)-dependent dehydrogenase (short-subunit alcohol dehydrogenase family)
VSTAGAHGRTVVITGGTGALGGAVVRRLLAEGARCVVTYVVDAELARFGERDRVELARVDCTSESEVQTFYGSLPALGASIHLVGGFAMAKATDTALADFEGMFRLNAISAFLCSREAVKRMRPGGGRIVNVGARPVLEPTAGMVAYATAKSAVVALTTALARELAPEGILVNAVLPSIMDTPQNRAAMPDADFARWPKVEQVAETIAFLAGPANTLTSGALVPVYGRA